MRVISNGLLGGGVFVYTRETEKLTGRGCVLVDKENTAGKPTTSCVSAIRAMPVKVAMQSNDILVNECSCTVNIPISINRVWGTSVDLNVNASVSPTAVYNPSGESIRAAISGVDYHSVSGVVTIGAGSLYQNFGVTLISNTDVNTKCFFDIKVNKVEYDTICAEDLTDASVRVVIQPTGV